MKMISHDRNSVARLRQGTRDGISNLDPYDLPQDDAVGLAREERRLQCLEEWVCELLIKNQQLRMAINELTERREGESGSLQSDT